MGDEQRPPEDKWLTPEQQIRIQALLFANQRSNPGIDGHAPNTILTMAKTFEEYLKDGKVPEEPPVQGYA